MGSQRSLRSKLCPALCLTVVWNITKDRCSHVLEGSQSSLDRIILEAWARLRIYISHHLSKKVAKIRLGRLYWDEAKDFIDDQ